MKQSGIEPATFRLIAQCLNLARYPVLPPPHPKHDCYWAEFHEPCWKFLLQIPLVNFTKIRHTA
jgi:hypothetical protein